MIDECINDCSLFLVQNHLSSASELTPV